MTRLSAFLLGIFALAAALAFTLLIVPHYKGWGDKDVPLFFGGVGVALAALTVALISVLIALNNTALVASLFNSGYKAQIIRAIKVSLYHQVALAGLSALYLFAALDLQPQTPEGFAASAAAAASLLTDPVLRRAGFCLVLYAAIYSLGSIVLLCSLIMLIYESVKPPAPAP